jgi:NADPH:quinone reductase-like Zn-dependent oxidoreductase
LLIFRRSIVALRNIESSKPSRSVDPRLPGGGPRRHGRDPAINYRPEDIKSALARYCPTGIDVYFDNVGGPILHAVLEKDNVSARIALCGMVSDYTREQGMRITNLRHLTSSAGGSRPFWSWITGRTRWRRRKR